MQESLMRRLEQLVPFEIVSANVLADGAANLAIEINADWIFRSSRSGLTSGQMRLENTFLPLFQRESPIPVPVIERSGIDFMLYKKLPGQPLRAELLASLPKSTQDRIAADLGAFLTTLHGFRFSHPDLHEFPYGGEDFWRDVWEPASRLLSDAARQCSKAYFEDAFHWMSAHQISKTLVHADLGTSNVLFDASRNRLGGIIDFGDLCLHDPARDFNGILRNHGRSFTERVLRYYEGKADGYFWDRIEFYAKKHPLMMLLYAPKFGFEKYIPVAIKDIERNFGAK